MVFKIKHTNPLLWLVEPLEDHAHYFRKKWFGCDAVMFNGMSVLVLTDGEEPWNGLLIPTYREHHESLINDFPALAEHSILGKWLYLSQRHTEFEETATNLVQAIRVRDPRIGIEPKPRKRKKAKK
jgi:hypothetical protein